MRRRILAIECAIELFEGQASPAMGYDVLLPLLNLDIFKQES